MNAAGRKVIVFGSRDWSEPTVVKRRLVLLPRGSTIVHGASPGGGADYFADVYGKALGHTVIAVPINDEDRRRAREWGRPKMAPILRNERMADEHEDADYAIAFWDGKTRGSKDMKERCERHGLTVEVIYPGTATTRADGPSSALSGVSVEGQG